MVEPLAPIHQPGSHDVSLCACAINDSLNSLNSRGMDADEYTNLRIQNAEVEHRMAWIGNRQTGEDRMQQLTNPQHRMENEEHRIRSSGMS